MRRRYKHGPGFTLIETLVALAIVAIALSAALRATLVNMDAVDDLQMRTQAAWVASNVINRMVAARAFPALGALDGKTRQGQTDFIWRQEVTVTPNYSFRRVEVKVFPPDSSAHILARQVSYVARQ